MYIASQITPRLFFTKAGVEAYGIWRVWWSKGLLNLAKLLTSFSLVFLALITCPTSHPHPVPSTPFPPFQLLLPSTMLDSKGKSEKNSLTS